MGRKMRALCITYRKGWSVYSKYPGRKPMIKELRRLKFEGYNAIPIKLGGLACKEPYAIMIHDISRDVRCKLLA